jgi:hypothetical protein
MGNFYSYEQVHKLFATYVTLNKGPKKFINQVRISSPQIGWPAHKLQLTVPKKNH